MSLLLADFVAKVFDDLAEQCFHSSHLIRCGGER
jgi:hypothetical protein